MQWIKSLAMAVATCFPLIATALPAETSVQIPGPQGPLAGSLLTTEHNAAVVIIIPGSGPTDRNGNSRQVGLSPWTYKLIAQGLAEQGVASLRIDKRGIRGSAGAIGSADDTTVDDYASDIKAWSALLRKRLPSTPIWLLGHSQGGLVALLAGHNNPEIHGLILAASAGRRLDAVIREQLQNTPEGALLVEPASALLQKLSAGEQVDNKHIPPALLPVMRQEVQGLLISELVRDPVQLIAQISQPILILQGDQDLQITASDARLLQAAQPNARLLMLAHANHVFKDVPTADRQANLSAYSDPDLPLAAGLIPALGAFILEH